MDKFIELKNVTFSYITEYDDETVKTTALKSISLEINRGELWLCSGITAPESQRLQSF